MRPHHPRTGAEPGRPSRSADTQYVVPDVYVVKVEDRYEIQPTTRAFPAPYQSLYRKILGQRRRRLRPPGVHRRAAALGQWLIKGWNQRNKTIYKVARAS